MSVSTFEKENGKKQGNLSTFRKIKSKKTLLKISKIYIFIIYLFRFKYFHNIYLIFIF